MFYEFHDYMVELQKEQKNYHMNKKQYTRHIVTQLLNRSLEPTVKHKRFLRIVRLSMGCYVLSLFVFLLTGLAPVFGWLMNGDLTTMLALCSIDIVWRIRDITIQNRR